MAYLSNYTVTFQSSQVSSTQTNFPALISGTYAGAAGAPNLKTTANGGGIQNTVSLNGQTVPADLIFTSDAAGNTLLSWEVAAYSATTGQIEIWVNIPSLSGSSNTTIYMWYNNSAVSTYQCTATSTWDSNFVAVYHFGPSLSLSLNDSTINGYTLTNSATAATAASGKIWGGVQTDGAASYLVSGVLTLPTGTPLTMSAWLNHTSGTVAFGYLNSSTNIGNPWDGWYLQDSSGDWNYEAVNNNSFGTSISGAAITSGTAQYVVGVATSATSRTIYVNGTAAGPDTSSITPSSGTYEVGIGASYLYFNSASNYWKGIASEVRVSKTNRSANWITTEYNNQNSPSTFYTLAPANGCSIAWIT